MLGAIILLFLAALWMFDGDRDSEDNYTSYSDRRRGWDPSEHNNSGHTMHWHAHHQHHDHGPGF
jgi:hypothetical protein